VLNYLCQSIDGSVFYLYCYMGAIWFSTLEVVLFIVIICLAKFCLHAYVKFDALFKYLMNRSNLMQCLPHSLSLSHLCCRRPPRFVPLDPHVLHTPLELRNLCVTRFKLSWLTCTMYMSRVGSKLSPFLVRLGVTIRICYLWRDVRFGQNFCSVTMMFSAALFSGVQLESGGVMLSKFCLDHIAHHK
jgi:hypothetical protein